MFGEKRRMKREWGVGNREWGRRINNLSVFLLPTPYSPLPTP